jgi:pyruvate/2-oxoglutarate dehydrogenase complex dihydrolipoamide acyltransferase (E2) component
VFQEWKVKVDDTVVIGQEIAMVTGDTTTNGASAVGNGPAASHAAPRVVSPPPPLVAPGAPADLFGEPPPAPSGAVCMPALSPAITKRLNGVVPVNVFVDVRWDAFRTARDEAKKRLGRDAPSPSAMMAWGVTRVMEKHAGFRRIVARDGLIYAQQDFDLGIAVALSGDRLATAAVVGANRLAWPDFVAAYNRAIAETRAGKIADLQAPLNISSLGAFGIETAVPLVVPPAMSTLFIGAAHERLHNDHGVIHPIEVITLSLTFDHRVVNGMGAAAFMAELKQVFESFKLPG